MDPLLLPFEAVRARQRTLPPACKVPLNRAQRVDLLMCRDSQGFLLWNPADNFDHHAMTREGFAGQKPRSNGSRKDDQAAPTISIQDMADAIARQAEERRQRRGAA